MKKQVLIGVAVAFALLAVWGGVGLAGPSHAPQPRVAVADCGGC